MGALVVRIVDLRDKAVEISEEFPASRFPLLSEMVEGGELAITSPLRVEATAAWEFDHIRVKGLVSAGVRYACSRCLAGYDDRLSSAFVLFFTRSSADKEPPDEEVELSDVDLVSVTFQGDEIDLAPVVEEQFISELPMKPLCREECRGLCGSCGADLNDGDCGCGGSSAAHPFGVLRNLKINQQ